MKKINVFSLATTLITIFMCYAMILSCGSDDDGKSGNSSGSNDISSQLVGTWTLVSCSESGAPIGGTYTFYSDKSGYSSADGEKFNFLYNSNGDFMMTYLSSGNSVIGNFTISGETFSGSYKWSGKSTTHTMTLKKGVVSNNDTNVVDNNDTNEVPNVEDNTDGDNSSGGSSSTTVKGKVKGTIKAIGPGVVYDSYASYADGKTTTVDYEYYPSSGTYYVYGGTYDSSPSSNGGKGLRYNATKGYNSITIHEDFYRDYSTKIIYRWSLQLRVTLP